MSSHLVSNDVPCGYKTTFEIFCVKNSNLLQRAAVKAKEFNVCGYIAYAHCNCKAGGELEGPLENINRMIDWLRQQGPEELREKSRFMKCEPYFQPKFRNFFCC